MIFRHESKPRVNCWAQRWPMARRHPLIAAIPVISVNEHNGDVCQVQNSGSNRP
jgi:hypothetical protein